MHEPSTEPVMVDTDGGPRLVGSKCRGCGAVSFPEQGSCARCTGEDVDRYVLPASGTLWGFTVQGFAPKVPYLAADDPFTPFGLGYVDLGGEVLVEARLAVADPAQLEIGMAMELTLEPFHRGADGTTACSYAFRPVDAAEVTNA